MQMKADTSHILMSEMLRDQVPELDGEQLEEITAKHVTIIAERLVAGKSDPLIGVLRGIVTGDKPELEFRCEVSEALKVLQTKDLSFGRIELHHGEDTVVRLDGPFDVKAVRIDEILAHDQLCTLGLHLAKRTA